MKNITSNHDSMQNFVFEKAPIRGELVHINSTYQTILNQHNYPPLIRKLLGELLVVASLLSAIIKFKGRLTVQFQGKEKLRLLLAQGNHQQQIRGIAQWKGDLDEITLLEELKKGIFVIIIDPGSRGKSYQGMVSWQGNSISESIEGYFRDSEQLLTRIWLAVDENNAAGLLLQVMPNDKANVDVQEVLFWEHATTLANTIKSEELLHLDNETLLRRLFAEEEIRAFAPAPIEFRCTCSIERGENALLLLGKEEVDEELKDKSNIDVTCDFCNNKFIFDRVDVAKLFSTGNKPPTSDQVQ